MTNSISLPQSATDEAVLRFFKDRFRILLIIYFFAEETENPELPKVHYGEIKIQAIDFFIRNPDYLAYELLNIAAEQPVRASEIEKIVRKIYMDAEPQIRRQEMEKFFYGAYEDIDDIIAFLHSRQLIYHQSKRRTNQTVAEKHYYLTGHGLERVEAGKKIPIAKWYFERCAIIKEYLGGATGSELKSRQYQVEEYSNTTYKDKIQEINDLVLEKFETVFNKQL